MDAHSTSAESGDSPFHEGELAVQERVGVRARFAATPPKGIRTVMPEQHRQFFAQLPFFLLGSADGEGRVWASILTGAPGFIAAPDERTLHIAAVPTEDDPLATALHNGARLGGLGIELQTRRRNRVNGTVTRDADGKGFSLAVEQSFGNCAQYIQARAPRALIAGTKAVPVRRTKTLDADMRAIVAGADTFFIASRAGGEQGDPRQGADVSHRGGRPGFTDILDERTLQWPDYRGNFFFNTLGNLAVDARCGLLFIDFARGGAVQLTGRGEILWDWDRANPALRDAQRAVRFHLDEAIYRAEGVPLAWDFLSQAPQLADRP